ncbi:hypothetical protein OAG82_00145 [Rubripirellula sp.]|nr:hypothetical protein [Rubripirellula sp.]MDB4621240.1 hypothetical protein [Rubripirellula sp.]
MKQQEQQRCPACMRYCGIDDLVCPECAEELDKPIADAMTTGQPDSLPVKQEGASLISSGVAGEGGIVLSDEDSGKVESREEGGMENPLPTADGHALNDPYRSAVPVDLPPSQWGALSTAEIVVGVVWIVACVPVLFFMPGLGIALLSFSLPPLVRTALVVARRRHGGKEFSPVQKVGLFVGSAVLTALGTITVGVCVLAGTFAGCFAGMPAGGDGGPVVGMVLGGIGGLLLGVWGCSRVVSARWLRDMNR